MGFFRGGLLFIVSVLLFITLFLTAIFLTLSWSLQYENVQTEFGDLARELTGNNLNLVEGDFNLTLELQEVIEPMKLYCQNATEYVFSEGGYTFVFSCDDIENIGDDPNALFDKGAEIAIEQIYYDEYDCDFLDCLRDTEVPVFLVSEKAKDYWKGKFFLTLMFSLVLIIISLLLVENKLNLPISLGTMMVFVAIPLAQIEKIAGSIAGDSYLAFFGVFFSKAGSVFWILIILGLVLIIPGIILRLLGGSNLFRSKFLKKKND